MAIEVHIPYTAITCNGSASYDFDFPVRLGSYVAVRRIAADGSTSDLTYGVDYDVAGINGTFEAGGTVTPAVTYTDGELFIYRDTPLEQQAAFPPTGPFPSVAVTNQFDNLVMMLQELGVELGRAFQAPVEDGQPPHILPDLETRKGKFFYFRDSDGQPIASGAISATIVAAYMENTFLLLTSANAVRSELGVGQKTDFWEIFRKEILQADVGIGYGLDASKGTGNTIDVSAGGCFLYDSGSGDTLYFSLNAVDDYTPDTYVTDDTSVHYVKMILDGSLAPQLEVDTDAPTTYEIELARFVTSAGNIPASLDITHRSDFIVKPTRTFHTDTGTPTAADGREGDIWIQHEA